MLTPLLAASDYGLVVAVAVLFVIFLVVGWIIVQGTRAQMDWRKAIERGDIPTTQMIVGDEIARWKTMRMPRGTDPGIWHGVQSAELLLVEPRAVRISATADSQYAMVDGKRQEVIDSLHQGMRVSAKLADMVLYDIPNASLQRVQIDIYSTYRDDSGSSQRCILTTVCLREIADGLAWDEMDAEEVVRAFGGRFSLDDHGQPLPVDPDAKPRTTVPAVFYEDDE
jgi:hypothetical protein